MKRNSGIIGKISNVSLTSAPGVYDTFDAYNYKKNSNWPIAPTYDSLSLNSGTIYENTNQTITLYTSGFTTNTTLYWTILHGSSSSADFYNGVVSGSFTQFSSNNTGSFTFTTNFTPNTSKPTKTFQIQIREGSTTGTVKYTSGTFSIPAVTTSVYWSSSTVNEGGSSTLYVTLNNCGSANVWSANLGWGGTASQADFSFRSSSMSIGGGTYSSTVTLSNDSTTEGTETATANVTFGDIFSTIYTIGSATLTINDTSVYIDATISSITSTTPNEGTSFTVNVTSGAPNGTTLYWTAENVSAFETADLSAISGSFTINSGAGSFSFNITADGYTEGTEQFLIRIRRDSTSGTILATSSTISIQDTSTGTAEPVFTETLFTNMCAYLDDYLSEYKNPSFYEYSLNGDQTYISDGGSDMYDSGNFTYAWPLSNTVYAGNHYSSAAPALTIGYSNSTATTTIDTSFVYRSLGYTRPLTVLAYRSAASTPIGFQKGGNLGADGSGLYASGLIYDNATVNTFTVYAFRRIAYNAYDPSVCDLYMLIGHTNWGSSFGARTFSGDASTDSGGSYFYAAASTNVVAVAMLLSKSGGAEVTAAECQTVVQNFTSRMKIHLGY